MEKQSLFILPFDHRSSFLKKMFGSDGRDLTAEELNQAVDLKQTIYQGFKLAVESGAVPKASAAILVDEQFGDAILKDAKAAGYLTCLSTEKSGQDEYAFEYGADFGVHINKYQPTYAKALVRYNPEGDQDLNVRQRARLKELSDFCRQNGYGFIIEPLVPATTEQLSCVDNDGNRYDCELRPGLMVKMIVEMQADGIEPDVWKIEGFIETKDYELLVKQIKAGGRKANAIVLGRGADDAQVEKWLKAGAKVSGVIGFAVGRTIFWQSLVDYKAGKISQAEAAEQISRKFQHFYQVFVG
ncbi:MAG: DUF2090 domain-containing protein [Patescibacteria group bacterium]|jgi:myo-inositol catabolism protein IolC